MSNSFENPDTPSSEKEPKEERAAAESIKEAEERLKERVATVDEEAQERLDGNQTIKINGTTWDLEEISDEYLSPAFEQNKLQILKEIVGELQEINERAEEMSEEQASSYYMLQGIGQMVRIQELREEKALEEAMMKATRPDMFQVAFEPREK